ncbi:hypothetical protein H4R19_002276 [Coemansia spiralis]|nr:hypothetical protein H4R19_002276 [Coemansia spiralis]
MYLHVQIAAGLVYAGLAMSLNLPESVQMAVAMAYTAQGAGTVNGFDRELMLALVNSERAARSVSPVAYHDALMQLAQDHAEYQATNRVVTHADTSGPIGDRLTRLGFRWTMVAENVGAGAPNEDAIMAAWAGSSRHLANILHPAVKYMGIGVSNGFWVQDFAAP